MQSGRTITGAVIWMFAGLVVSFATPTSGWTQSSGAESAVPKMMPKVRAEAHLSVSKLIPGESCQILIRLHVLPEWHINSNPAKPANYIPTEVTFRGKNGTKLTGVKYPKGEQLRMKDSVEPLSVYTGKVDLFGRLEVPANAAGQTEEMEISVRFQACNDEVCLLPDTVKLSGKLAIAHAGEPVKSINEKLFQAAARP